MACLLACLLRSPVLEVAWAFSLSLLGLKDLGLAQPHAGQLLHELGDGGELAHCGAVGVEEDDGVSRGLLVVMEALVLLGFAAEVLRLLVRSESVISSVLDLIQFLDRLEAAETTLDGGHFPVDLVERQALVGVGFGRYGRGLGGFPRDLLEGIRVEDLNVEADGAVSLPDLGAVGVL